MSGEIITNAEMRAIDAGAAAAGVPTRTLMEHAGKAVADAVAARFERGPVLVACGPGNNGGDGWVAARLLMERGWPVRVETLVPRSDLRGDARDAASRFVGAVAEAPGDLGADVFIDAMFGGGLSRPLEERAADLAAALSRTPERVIAVDVPSGLDGDTGKPLGGACVKARASVTFERKKAAHVLYPGRGFCGEVVLCPIGVPAEVIAAQGIRLWENEPSLWQALFPWPSPQAHKHARGHVMVASGGAGRTGAARLAARTALRAGAGLVTVLSPGNAMMENAAHLTAIMLRRADDEAQWVDAARHASALVIGPAFGVEEKHRAVLTAVLGADQRPPCVLDADALTLLAPLSAPLNARDVLTPHIGEFGRLFPGLLESAQSKIEATREAAKRAGAVVLLKGPDTVIAAPDGRAIVNTKGSPFLATAGSGDVLAGIIAALIAQGMASFEAAAAGAWLHGAAGEAFGAGLISEDLPDLLPRVLDTLAPAHLKRVSE
ncbi:MAG: NAD(P)H-hydrate dehydratase [Terricaulis sp.]